MITPRREHFQDFDQHKFNTFEIRPNMVRYLY
jgi:hypothetical protein